jgi:hypothetical protein
MVYELEAGVLDDGSELEFDPKADPKADNLEGVVAGTGIQSAGSGNNLHGFTQEYMIDQLTFLGRRYKDFFSKTYEGIFPTNEARVGARAITHSFPDDTELFLANIIRFDNSANDTGIRISLNEIDVELLKLNLEQRYGAEIKDSGIYEACGIDGSSILNQDSLRQYFVEFKDVFSLNGRFVPRINDRFQQLFVLPVKYRAFFTGAMRDKYGDNKNFDDKKISFYRRELNLMDTLNHAKKINCVPRVKELMDAYNVVNTHSL